jgi:hypothetical protein
MAAPRAHFSGEKRFHSFLSPIVTDPQQSPSLQIVDHRQIDLPLPSAHLIDANDMHWRTHSMSQTICHRSFHDGRHALPVQTVLASRSLPTQLPRQSRHRIR